MGSSKRFVPPTAEEVATYCLSRKNGIDPEHFVDYYEARGWELKPGQKMKVWQAAVRTWERNEKARQPILPLEPPIVYRS